MTADSVNYKADTLVVLLDSEPITGTDGTYTISALDKDHVVTVTIEKKAEYTVTKTTMDGVTITGEDKVLETDPYSFTVTSHIIVTFAMALAVIVGITVIGFIRHGFGFLKLFVPSGVPAVLLPLPSPRWKRPFPSR